MTASAQADRRRAARARGDCGVCCKRPALPSRFRCTPCRKLRSNESKRARPHVAGSCSECGGPSERFQACVACRQERQRERAARRERINDYEQRLGEGVAA